MKTSIPTLLLFVFSSFFSYSQIQYSEIVNGDVDGDSIEDFTFTVINYAKPWGDSRVNIAEGTIVLKNEFEISVSGRFYTELFKLNDSIHSNKLWSAGPKLVFTAYSFLGDDPQNWSASNYNFLGIRQKKQNDYYYGWLRIKKGNWHGTSVIVECAMEQSPNTPILAGNGINSIKSFQPTATNKKNNGTWNDIEVNFFFPFYTSAVQEYRIFIFENTADLSISVEELLNIPLPNYQKVEPGGREYKTELASDFLDVDGNNINSNKEYKICILSISNNTDNFPHAFNLSPAFSIETILPNSGKPTVIDSGNNGNSKDLSIHFPRNPREDRLEEYRFLILPLDSVLTFNLKKAQQITIGNYYSVLPNNDSIYFIQNELLKDIYGNDIKNEKLYQTFTYSVPDNIIANVGSLSTGSNILCLGNPNYFYAGQKAGKVNYTNFDPDLNTDSLNFDYDNDDESELSFTHYSSHLASMGREYWNITTGNNTQIIFTENNIATNLLLHSTINKFKNWGSGTFRLAYTSYGPEGNVRLGEFHGRSVGIVGFRKLLENDTIYGWVNLDIGYPTIICDYAWQNNSMRFFPDTIETSFQLYPNPNIERILRIAVKEFDPINEYYLDIINSSGKQINSLNISKKLTEISVAHLQRGLYYVRLRSPEKQETQKIIVL